MRPCPAGRGGDGTALVIPCHVAFAGRQRGADLSKSRATPPPKRGSKKIWGQLWGHVIFSIMKKSFIFSMLLTYFVFPRRKPLDSLRHGNASQAVFLCPFLAFGCAYALSVKLLIPDKLWTVAPRESVCCKSRPSSEKERASFVENARSAGDSASAGGATSLPYRPSAFPKSSGSACEA